ncbi:MAG: twitching motility protein PilT [Anaerolineae bacterium]|nr:MAG: twitching motility protein PilT [Anaerolineae bacterium]
MHTQIPPVITVILHGTLNDFLPARRREQPQDFPCPPGEEPAIKHVLECLGVPHVEIATVHVDGRAAPLSEQVGPGRRVDAYPYQSSPWPPRNGVPRFVLDNHLGKLASYLRILGFDTLYRNDFQDPELARLAATGRILLTRDRQLLMRNAVQYGYWMRSKSPRQQLQDTIRYFGLSNCITPFRRCPRCNALLEHAEKREILEHLEPLTRRYYDDFHRCPSCGQIYWQGSHYQRIAQWVETLQRP